jgi:hypothetical protein
LDELLKAQGRIPAALLPANGAGHANGTAVNGVADGKVNGVANGSGKVAAAGSSSQAAAAEGGSSSSKGRRSQGGAKKRDPVAAR